MPGSKAQPHRDALSLGLKPHRDALSLGVKPDCLRTGAESTVKKQPCLQHQHCNTSSTTSTTSSFESPDVSPKHK